jgi:di/tripeptidase
MPAIRLSDTELADLSFASLQRVVAIDSQSDEHSTAIPSTEGQRRLAEVVAAHFANAGASVETDAHANVIASWPGRGRGVSAPPIALLVHLDTARGTDHPDTLSILPDWDGSPVPFAENPDFRVDTAHYPGLATFLGHTLVHGRGRSPFGLDDKLGLTHLLTLCQVLASQHDIDHPPLLFVGRPDEEIGRMEAVEGLADLLAARGVRSGYTIDGILPFEVNVANFNGAHATITFEGNAVTPPADAAVLEVHFGGVNTHGATAHAEGHRTALRFAAELLTALREQDIEAHPHAFNSDRLRDCDGVLVLLVRPADHHAAMKATRAIVAPHIPRGASLAFQSRPIGAEVVTDDVTARLLAAVTAFTDAPSPWPLWAEDSSGWQGYSHPYRARSGPGLGELDIRIRDFDPETLEARKREIEGAFGLLVPPGRIAIRDQYVNMGPRLADRRDLVELAVAAGADIGVQVVEQPIRGGTGVDPFLERGTAIANLGTGYFAPESEKELTTLQLMAAHVRWLAALCERLATL